MFGPPRLGAQTQLRQAGDSAYSVLASRVAAETPEGGNREARVLGCWCLVHGLAVLFLDASPEDVTRSVADALMARGSDLKNKAFFLHKRKFCYSAAADTSTCPDSTDWRKCGK